MNSTVPTINRTAINRATIDRTTIESTCNAADSTRRRPSAC
jgi:hypothetical protein